MSPLDARKPTADDVLGMAWWNGLAEQRRAYWLQLSKSNVAQPRRGLLQADSRS